MSVVADHICRSVEERFPDIVCSILTVDASGLLHPLSAPSLPPDFSGLLDNIAAGPQVGSCGTAAYTRRNVEVRDIASDPRWIGYAEPVLAGGLVACWSSPLLDVSGSVIATFALYFRQSRGPRRAERDLVKLCMHLCDLALARASRVQDRERRASIDALTGLPNRSSFEHALAHLGCSRPGIWAIFLIDLDNLKMTNDTFGHAAGDRLLQEASARMGQLAAPDRIFRTGGDEFAIVVMAPDRLARVSVLGEEIHEALRQPIEFASFSISPKATIGCAIVSGDEDSAYAVYRNADIALYHAKDTHPGGFICFRSELDSSIVARLSSIDAVKSALDEGRIEAWYQPFVELAGGKIIGFEALCRMTTPEGEIVTASSFSEATTDARIASTITRQMLRQVASDMKRWRNLGIPLSPISINITTVDLQGGKLLELIDQTFGDDKELLSNLCLEVTEGAYLDKRAHLMIDVIHELRRRGIRIALDDFGTGYASLTHLLNLPIDIIKIDRSFVERLPADELSATIISAIISIAGKIGASVTAEGVETVEQAALLTELECFACQGYLYAPARPQAEAAQLALRHSISGDHPIPIVRTHGVTCEPSRAARHRDDNAFAVKRS
nr:EAL domain-containing protein [Sphingobium lactosutens]